MVSLAPVKDLVEVVLLSSAHSNSAGDTLSLPYAWQDNQWQRLVQLAADQKMPHALLLSGHSGVGKRHFAEAMGYYLLCLSPVNKVPCGRCKGCELNKAGTHPDLFVLEPEDGSRVIKIDQVRRLTEFVAKTSQQGGAKVSLINPVEALNVNAANALLKSLEEPSGDTVLLLVTQSPTQVMATIRSRCQLMEFGLPSRPESLAWLEPLAVGHDPQYLLDSVGGAPLAALQLLEDDTLEQLQSLVDGLLGLAHSRCTALELAAKLHRNELLPIIEFMMKWLQLGQKRSVAPLQGTHTDTEAELLDVLSTIPATIMYRFWDKMVIVKRQLLSASNPNKQLLLEELFMDWQALTKQSQKLAQSRQQMMNGLL